MSWLFPLYLAGAAAVIAPILLHLRRRPPQDRVEFSSLLFLDAQTPVPVSKRRLENWLLLATALPCAHFARLDVLATLSPERLRHNCIAKQRHAHPTRPQRLHAPRGLVAPSPRPGRKAAPSRQTHGSRRFGCF
ncbi:MAG: BatA domain-containing protein [Verrucomicrobiaceae bacterium]|nr:BatA domain-containing protein [Verrucomicrobiaceae bacterium]